jgi:ribosomal-protein-alanine N-acetyltransferase
MRVDAGEIYVRLLRPDDAPAQLDLLERNREFFRPFEPRRPPGQWSLEAQRDLLTATHERNARGEEFSFGVFRKEDDLLIGRVNLTNIIRRAFQNAYLGYYLDRAHNGRGHMTTAVGAVVGYALGPVRLHRVQAAVMPENTASVRVLQKVGFRLEGRAHGYLRIDGRWRDHDLYAITAEDPLPKTGLL